MSMLAPHVRPGVMQHNCSHECQQQQHACGGSQSQRHQAAAAAQQAMVVQFTGGSPPPPTCRNSCSAALKSLASLRSRNPTPAAGRQVMR